MRIAREIDPHDTAGVTVMVTEALKSVSVHCANDWEQVMLIQPSPLKNTPVLLTVRGEEVHLDEERALAVIRALTKFVG